ncbi:bile acid:sodium symporter family protein [Lignipirellula cremea]|uniref:Sodium Bile acid symporter family protein n=1 Tax=Lignipirellula cremea TaxID=2528010 RepID=A0A518E1W4_9BACT|nr:hypothetical protein [Lignipirellula cremea]QDU98078.1 Sodium Bile acid symporter family protein [Lignipirellula cremea]
MNFLDYTAELVRRRFLWLLGSVYLLAWLAPDPGTALCQAAVPLGDGFQLRITQLLLAMLLFNAGLGMQGKQLQTLGSRPGVLLIACSAKLAFFFLLLGVYGLAMALTPWLAQDPWGPIALGLVIVSSMPAANSSPAWSQSAGGSIPLSWGIVVLTTLASPALAVLIYQVTHAGVASSSLLDTLGEFLWFLACVTVPSLCGLLASLAAGPQRIESLKPLIRLVNTFCLLALIYAFGATAASRLSGAGNGLGLGVSVAGALFLCLASFSWARIAGRLATENSEERVAIHFGVGMFNNSIALTLGASIVDNDVLIYAPIVLFAMMQHLIAGLVDRHSLTRSETPPPATEPPAA